MSAQTPGGFGRDVYCDPVTEDADGNFSEVTGIALVKQDLRHRLLTDSVLPSPSGDDIGYDIRKLLGATAGAAASFQSRIKRVVLKDQRIDSADVVLTESTAGPLRTITVDVNGRTALGPFRLVFLLDPAATTGSLVSLILSQ